MLSADVRGLHHTKPLLRLESLNDFDRIPEVLRAEISTQLGVAWDRNNFEIRIISDDEKYADHYIRRIHAINDGVQFLLDNLPDISFTLQHELKKQLADTAYQCVSHLKSLASTEMADYQNSLYRYSQEVIQQLHTKLQFPDKDALIAQLDLAEQLALAKKTRPAICTIAKLSDGSYAAYLDKPEDPFNEKLKNDFLQIQQTHLGELQRNSVSLTLPPWFEAVNEHERILLKKFIDGIDVRKDLGTTINALSSKLRIIPAPANYGKHTLITLSDDQIVTVHPAEFRSSHIASRDVPTDNAAVREIHAHNNLLTEIEAALAHHFQTLREEARKTGKPIPSDLVIPILYQTLITPFKEPDSSLNEDKMLAIAAINEYLNNRERKPGEPDAYFHIVATNHPLNYGRFLQPTTPGSDTAESIENLLTIILHDPNQLQHPQHALLLEACHKLDECTNSNVSALMSYRELYLSSLEQITVSLYGGVSIGSCVSGKDRKAVEVAHTDAMKIYHTKYNSLPPLTSRNSAADDLAMQNFAKIFADVYCTNHQFAAAEQNAPGSFGVKTPAMYLPDHLKDAIKHWYEIRAKVDASYAVPSTKDLFKQSNRMASNNEISQVKKSKTQHDHSWKKSQDNIPLYDLRDETIAATLINAAIMGISEDLNTRPASPTFKEKFFRAEPGRPRSEFYQRLLSDADLDVDRKLIILVALLTSEKGKTLKANVFKQLSLIIPFESTAYACTTLKRTLRENGYSFEQIEEQPAAIIKLASGISNSTDVKSHVEDIKKSLLSIQHQPH